MRIKVLKDRPYEVTGNVPLREMKIGANEAGESTRWVDGKTFKTEETYHLCRCGKSKNKPFCDGSHTHGFDGTETADNMSYDDTAVVYCGDGMELMDDEGLCGGALFVTRQEAHGGSLTARKTRRLPSARRAIVRPGGSQS